MCVCVVCDCVCVCACVYTGVLQHAQLCVASVLIYRGAFHMCAQCLVGTGTCRSFNMQCW